MKFISHRGNVSGVDSEKENTIETIGLAIDDGFDVEIDLWFKNKKFYLGHDEPNNEIDLKYLLENSEVLWCHAKTILTLNELLKHTQINCFFHQKDDVTLTSHNHIWTYPEQLLTEHSILLKFDLDGDYELPVNIIGICSDYIKYYKNKYNL